MLNVSGEEYSLEFLQSAVGGEIGCCALTRFAVSVETKHRDEVRSEMDGVAANQRARLRSQRHAIMPECYGAMKRMCCILFTEINHVLTCYRDRTVIRGLLIIASFFPEFHC